MTRYALVKLIETYPIDTLPDFDALPELLLWHTEEDGTVYLYELDTAHPVVSSSREAKDLLQNRSMEFYPKKLKLDYAIIKLDCDEENKLGFSHILIPNKHFDWIKHPVEKGSLAANALKRINEVYQQQTKPVMAP